MAVYVQYLEIAVCVFSPLFDGFLVMNLKHEKVFIIHGAKCNQIEVSASDIQDNAVDAQRIDIENAIVKGNLDYRSGCKDSLRQIRLQNSKFCGILGIYTSPSFRKFKILAFAVVSYLVALTVMSIIRYCWRIMQP